jgi:2,4-dienoyl-CoA reductase-like NADH-dependent reductase (Old Yellow Enzyme family)/thioredoxin reductase
LPKLEALFTPIKIGPLQLPNRIVMSAITTLYDVEDGPRWSNFYQERARGGAGLIIVGGLQTIFPGRNSRTGKVHLYEDRNLDRLKELTASVHEAGGLVAAQLATHNYWSADGQAGTAGFIGPSEVEIPTDNLHPAYCSEKYLPKVRALGVDEIAAIVESVGDAAGRAKRAGFDAVELLAAAGNLFNRFINPCTNRRNDVYGGSLENRLRIVTETIANIQKKTGRDFPLICRISALDMLPWGMDLKSWQQAASSLEKAGVHALSIYPGWHETREPRHQMCVPRGNFVYLAQAIKQVTKIPVAANGRINDVRLADRIIAEGKADFIAMGTPLIADPELPNKAREGRLDDIRMCCGCCNCWDRLVHGEPISCSVNPTAGLAEGGDISGCGEPKKVFVIGGGPAGMEAARVAAMRGHHVRLYEKSRRLGGQLLYAVLPPHKDEWNNLTAYLGKQIDDLEIDLRLNTEFTVDIAQQERPDSIIVATGAQPIIPAISGINGQNVMGALEVLAGRPVAGEKVAVIGGGAIGCETAEFLKEAGKTVTIFEMLDEIGQDLNQWNRWVVLDRLAGVGLRTGTTVREVCDQGVKAAAKDGEVRIYHADTVVYAVGMRPVDPLSAPLLEGGADVRVIGDAAGPGLIRDAIAQGFRAAMEI